jgi:hypothetical protein
MRRDDVARGKALIYSENAKRRQEIIKEFDAKTAKLVEDLDNGLDSQFKVICDRTLKDLRVN